MHRRPIRRATSLAFAAVMIFAGTAFADQLLPDADVTMAGIQGTNFIDNVPAGSLVTREVDFRLTCVGLNHVDVDQSVVLSKSELSGVPGDGAIVSVTNGSVGPIEVDDGWAADGFGCPSPVASMMATVRSQVTLRAPTTTGLHTFTIVYDRSLSPADPDTEASPFSLTRPMVDFRLNVVNAAPTLNLPASHSEEGNTTGGWIADWSGVSATDPEDDPDPTPTCTPVSGTKLLLDTTTTVTCTVTDTGLKSTTGSFAITVVDSTDPVLHDMPGDISVTTNDPAGAVVTYVPPTATDIVDSSPDVACVLPSGGRFPVGHNTVTCTATDGSGNSTTANFTVDVRFVAPAHVATALWLEPVGDGQAAFVANHGRTIPVKVRLFVDGVERSSGQAQLTLTPCDGGAVALELALEWSGGRWNASLDTSMLPGNCYTVAASIDGVVAGSVRMELHGDPTPARSKASTTTSALPKKTGQLKPR
jgi:hypothetical protein